MTDWSFVVFLQLKDRSRPILVPRGLNWFVTGLDQSLYITTTRGLKMLGSTVVKSYTTCGLKMLGAIVESNISPVFICIAFNVNCKVILQVQIQFLLPSQIGIILVKHLHVIKEVFNLLLLISRPCSHIIEVRSPCRPHDYQLFKNCWTQACLAVYHNSFAAPKQPLTGNQWSLWWEDIECNTCECRI